MLWQKKDNVDPTSSPGPFQGPDWCTWVVVCFIIANSLGSLTLSFLGYQVAVAVKKKKKQCGTFYISIVFYSNVSIYSLHILWSMRSNPRATLFELWIFGSGLILYILMPGRFWQLLAPMTWRLSAAFLHHFIRMVALSWVLKLLTCFGTSVAQVMFSASFCGTLS